MKKSLYTLLSFLAPIFLILTSCGPTATEKEKARVERKQTPNPIVWDTINVVKTEPIELDSIKATCVFDMCYIVPKEYQKQEIIRAIQEELSLSITNGDNEAYKGLLPTEVAEQYVDAYLANYEQEIKNQYEQWKKASLVDGTLSYNKSIGTEVKYDEANLISYQIRFAEQRSDETPITLYKNLLFDLTDGRKLSEEDIFRENYSEDLNKILIEQLLRDNGAQTIENLQALGYWGARDIAANNNFYVNEKGVTYTFNTDEYSDAELGVLNICINYEDLHHSGILKENSPITILINSSDSNKVQKENSK